LRPRRRKWGNGQCGNGRNCLRIRSAAIHRFKIDDVAQEHLAFVQLVAPDGQGLKRQRALTQRADHQLATGLDALGDRDFAFARQ